MKIDKTTRNNIVIITLITIILVYAIYNYLNEFEKGDPKGQLELSAPKLCEEIELESGFKAVMTFFGNCPKVNGEIQIGMYYGDEHKLIQKGEGNNSSFIFERSDTEVNSSNGGLYMCCKYRLE